MARAIKPGDATGWENVYGDIEEGWITFFNQLRHRIARHPRATRRTIILRGEIGLSALPGEPWYESRYQRGADAGGELAIVFAKPGGETTLLVTTHDLDDAAFNAAESAGGHGGQSNDRLSSPDGMIITGDDAGRQTAPAQFQLLRGGRLGSAHGRA